MPWPKLIVLCRHAESEGNIRSVDERAALEVASHNFSITGLGKKQTRFTRGYLHKKFGKFDVYYTSYYKRARQTMRILYPDARVFEDARLAESQRGIWSSMTRKRIKKLFPDELRRKEKEGLYHYRPFGGENWPDVEMRIHSFLSTLARDCGGKKVIIVCHGHWLTLFQRLIHHFSPEEAVRRYRKGVVKNASLTIYKGKKIGKKSRLVLVDENVVPWAGKI